MYFLTTNSIYSQFNIDSYLYNSRKLKRKNQNVSRETFSVLNKDKNQISIILKQNKFSCEYIT